MFSLTTPTMPLVFSSVCKVNKNVYRLLNLLLSQVSKGTVVKIMETIVGYVKRHTVAPVLTKAQQHEELEEEIRQRMIKAQKISYWRQFQQGLLGRDAARILIALADNVLSDPGRYVELHHINFRLTQWYACGQIFMH